MKLKRILSLALSGVLAISMLAGCGIGTVTVSGNKLSAETTAVRKAMNMELDTLAQDTVDYKSNSELANATAAVAQTVTVDEVKQASKTGTILGGDVKSMMGRYMKFTDWTNGFGPYAPAAGNGDKTYATALTFDGSMTAEEVGKAMADNVAKWNLKAVDKASFTFDGSVAAYKVTIKAADSESKDTTVWVVGLMLEQTEVKSGT